MVTQNASSGFLLRRRCAGMGAPFQIATTQRKGRWGIPFRRVLKGLIKRFMNSKGHHYSFIHGPYLSPFKLPLSGYLFIQMVLFHNLMVNLPVALAFVMDYYSLTSVVNRFNHLACQTPQLTLKKSHEHRISHLLCLKYASVFARCWMMAFLT